MNLRNNFIRGVLLFGLIASSAFHPINSETVISDAVPSANSFNAIGVYDHLQLSSLGLPSAAFNLAIKGWKKLKAERAVSSDIISICDFTQSSVNKRLYVIDLRQQKLLFNTLVAHGKNTGEEYAHSFSNEPSSNKSSLGFYITGKPYNGKHGLSLKLQGIENGFNDKAEDRAIVMHGADYVSQDFVSHEGRLGRSWGCPAVPFTYNNQIINTIKDGSCLFIYYPDKKYLTASALLK